VEWTKPVFPGDVLTGRATVTDLQRRNEKNGTVTVSLKAYNQRGETVLTSVTEAIVKCRKPEAPTME